MATFKNRTNSTSSGTAHSATAENYYDIHQGGSAQTVVKVLYWLCVAAGLWFAYLNILPYATAVKFVLSGTVDSGLMALLDKLPVIGAIVAFIGISVHWIIGFILWLVIQTVEVFPILLKRDRAFMRTVLSEQETSQKLPIRPNDDPTVRALKAWFNRFPMLTVTTARTYALFTYAVDFLICIAIYPPCDGGFSQFFFLLATGQFSNLNWFNISLTVVTLFAVEIIIRFLLWLGQIAYYYRLSRQ